MWQRLLEFGWIPKYNLGDGFSDDKCQKNGGSLHILEKSLAFNKKPALLKVLFGLC